MDCLMGTRFQQKYRAQIDAEIRILTLNNGVTISKHARIKNSYNTEPVTVNVQEGCITLARSQYHLCCHLNREQSDVREH